MNMVSFLEIYPHLIDECTDRRLPVRECPAGRFDLGN